MRAPAGHLGREEQRVPEGDAARVLHRAGVELRHERLVVVAERVADAEQPVHLVEPLPGQGEQLVGVGIELLGQAGACREAQRDAVVLVGDEVVRPGDERHEVRRQGRGLVEDPRPRLHLPARAVGHDDPVHGGADGQPVGRLEVGLVEAREHAGRGVHEGHAVDVVAPVGRVHAAVQALPVVAEPHDRVDDELVVAGHGLQGHPAPVQDLGVDPVAVEGDRAHRHRLEVHEGRTAAAAEADRGVRREGPASAARSSETSYDVISRSSRWSIASVRCRLR